MLSKGIQDALNKQVSEENYAAQYYLAMASWCDKAGLQGCAKFLYVHSEAERAHMMKLFRYVNDAGGHAVVGAIQAPPAEYKSITDVMELILKHERHVTQAINRLVDACLSEKDYSTFNFLQWYVAEQHEEERLIQSILDMIKVAGTEGRGLFLIDKEIGKLAAAPAK